MKKISFIVFFVAIIFYTTEHSAKEIQIYADSIDYDSNENIVAKGNVKIIEGNEVLTSSIIIINQNKKIITLPKEFQFKDEKDNYYYGTSGEFSTDFMNAKINDIKLLLNDGSRIVGSSGQKTDEQILINKGVCSPCESKIKKAITTRELPTSCNGTPCAAALAALPCYNEIRGANDCLNPSPPSPPSPTNNEFLTFFLFMFGIIAVIFVAVFYKINKKKRSQPRSQSAMMRP